MFGGFTNGDIVIQDCEKYDIENNTWTKINSMIYHRALSSACVIDQENIFIVGGYYNLIIDGVK